MKLDPEKFDQYHEIIQDQLKKWKVANKVAKNVYDIPHKLVIRKVVKSTKIRIVYDASSKASDSSP